MTISVGGVLMKVKAGGPYFAKTAWWDMDARTGTIGRKKGEEGNLEWLFSPIVWVVVGMALGGGTRRYPIRPQNPDTLSTKS